MNIKPSAAAVLTVTAVTGLAFAKAPDIDPARIDSMVAQVLNQADRQPDRTSKPDGKAIREDVVKHLQTVEILKNEALKAGLDKDPDVLNQWKTAEAEFYARQYALYLERDTSVDDAEVRRFYDNQTRMVKLQQVNFPTQEQALAAKELLLKGLSFEELMKRYPNPEQAFDSFVSPQQLPLVLQNAFADMVRGDVTHTPVMMDNRFYLFKISAIERNPEAEPLETVYTQIAQTLKEQKVRQKIDTVLKNNGITP